MMIWEPENAPCGVHFEIQTRRQRMQHWPNEIILNDVLYYFFNDQLLSSESRSVKYVFPLAIVH